MPSCTRPALDSELLAESFEVEDLLGWKLITSFYAESSGFSNTAFDFYYDMFGRNSTLNSGCFRFAGLSFPEAGAPDWLLFAIELNCLSSFSIFGTLLCCLFMGCDYRY